MSGVAHSVAILSGTQYHTAQNVSSKDRLGAPPLRGRESFRPFLRGGERCRHPLRGRETLIQPFKGRERLGYSSEVGGVR